MKRMVRAALASTALYLTAGAASAQVQAQAITARIDSGPLVGTADGAVVVFKGIPYAVPPVGPLRWAPPAPPAKWTKPLVADTFGPICPQKINADGSPNEGGAMGPTSEDCLTLNVWAPKGATKAPVMVWLHGGGNTMGAGSLGAYDGTAFARDGVVLVSINYRLGPLGFFAHPALTKAAKADEPLASYGVMDQMAALRWTRRNIAAFGGDAANVTVFGESAGGGDIIVLMASPLGRGLFDKAIVESGGGWSPEASLADKEAKGAALAKRAGAPDGATAAQLRALPVDAVLQAQSLDMGLAIDGRLLTESPTKAFAAGHVVKAPLMIGSNSYEASLIATFKMPRAFVMATLPAGAKPAYADLKSSDEMADAMFTDAVMGGPARWIAGKASGGPAWLYHFSYVPDMQRGHVAGAGHATEIPFVFDTWDRLGVLAGGVKPTPADNAVVAVMHACWVAFAKTGAPTCAAGAPAWPAYTTQNDTLMEFDGAPPGLRAHFRKPQLDAMEAAALPKLGVAP